MGRNAWLLGIWHAYPLDAAPGAAVQVIIDGIEYTPRGKAYQCSFSEAVEFKRLNLGITRKEAARRCGISSHTLYDIERDSHVPRFDIAAKIALGLGLDIGRLAETVLKNP